jgi:hypothetical protein
MSEVGMSESRINFIKQQGFEGADAESCNFQYPALMFQPRVVGLLVLTGVVLQAWPVFLMLSAVLWCSAVIPTLNPFDTLYNNVIAARRGVPGLTPAPAPRRFAQAMAATFMLLIGLCLLADLNTPAWVLETFMLVAISALMFGRFCLGSFVFHLLVGNGDFARRTVPWGRDA